MHEWYAQVNGCYSWEGWLIGWEREQFKEGRSFVGVVEVVRNESLLSGIHTMHCILHIGEGFASSVLAINTQ